MITRHVLKLVYVSFFFLFNHRYSNLINKYTLSGEFWKVVEIIYGIKKCMDPIMDSGWKSVAPTVCGLGQQDKYLYLFCIPLAMLCMQNVMYFAGWTVYITMKKITDSNSGFLETDKEDGGFCLGHFLNALLKHGEVFSDIWRHWKQRSEISAEKEDWYSKQTTKRLI